MSDSKHTPGPWEIAEFGRNHTILIYGPDEILVADCGGILRRSHEEMESNARLIAAAPDLLAALEDVVRVADRDTVIFDVARAAIAKAKGESQ